MSGCLFLGSPYIYPLKFVRTPHLGNVPNLLSNMTGARTTDLVLLHRQLQVRLGGWINLATSGGGTTQQTKRTSQKTFNDMESLEPEFQKTLLDLQRAELKFPKRQKTEMAMGFFGKSEEVGRMDIF